MRLRLELQLQAQTLIRVSDITPELHISALSNGYPCFQFLANVFQRLGFFSSA